MASDAQSEMVRVRPRPASPVRTAPTGSHRRRAETDEPLYNCLIFSCRHRPASKVSFASNRIVFLLGFYDETAFVALLKPITFPRIVFSVCVRTKSANSI